MQIPNWVKPGVWGAILGAVAVTAVGFGADIVVTSGNAEETAARRSQEAVIAALTPICVAQFKGASKEEQVASLTTLEKETYYLRGEYIEEQGWATMPGSSEPNDAVADACAIELLELAD